MEVNWLLESCVMYSHSTLAGLGTTPVFESFLTFWTSMTEGRKEAVFSSVMSGRGDECWCWSGCLVSPSPSFRSSSPTRCLWRRLYGALKFLMKASLSRRRKQRITSRLIFNHDWSFYSAGVSLTQLKRSRTTVKATTPVSLWFQTMQTTMKLRHLRWYA